MTLRRDAEVSARVKEERRLEELINARTVSGTAPAWALPVGSIHVSVDSTNPATTLGYGTWAAFGTGRVLVGVDTGDTDFDTVMETGGSKTLTI